MQKRLLSTACYAKPSGRAWHSELAELNDAIRKSCDDEEEWELADEVVNQTESLNLIADQERVYLVGVHLKSERSDGDNFTGARILAAEYSHSITSHAAHQRFTGCTLC